MLWITCSGSRAALQALPAVYILEVIRVAHRHSRAQLPIKIAGAYFGVTMPLGILLPVCSAKRPPSRFLLSLALYMSLYRYRYLSLPPPPPPPLRGPCLMS